MFRYLSIFICLLVSSMIADVKVYSTVDTKYITIHEAINFKVVAEGSEGFPVVDISQIKDFSVISGPSQNSSFQWINGEVFSTKSLSWTLAPNRVGKLQIPELTVIVDRDKYTLESIQVTVTQLPGIVPKGQKRRTKKKRNGKLPDVFLRAESDKSEAFQGEQITVYYQLYTKVNLRQYSVEKKPKGVGFWQEELYAPKQPVLRETQVEGIRYRVATLYKMAVFPTTTGSLTLEPMVVNCTIEIPSKSRLSPFFDDFFSDTFFSKTKNVVVQSQSIKLTINPVPEIGKPPNYSGAVGEFTLEAFLDTSITEVNQAVTYILELSGTGNLNLFDLDVPDFPQTLEVFEPKTSFEKDEFRDDLTGKKRWQYILIPRKAGQYFIPKQTLTYLNPESGKWETTVANNQLLTVKPSKKITAQTRGLTKEEIALLEQDIRYIHTKTIKLIPLKHRLITIQFIWMNLLGLFFFVSPKLIEVVKNNIGNDNQKLRSNRALKKAQKKLKKVKDKSDYTTISKQVFEYVGNKLDVSPTSLDSRSIQNLLSSKLKSDLMNELIKILHQCDESRFAPEFSSKNAIELARHTIVILTRMDKDL